MAGPTVKNTAEMPVGAIVNGFLNLVAIALEFDSLLKQKQLGDQLSGAPPQPADSPSGVVLNVNCCACGKRHGYESEASCDYDD